MAGVKIGPAPGSFTCTRAFRIRIGSTDYFLTSGHCTASSWYHGSTYLGSSQATLYPVAPDGTLGKDLRRVFMSSAQASSWIYLSPTSSLLFSAWPFPIQYHVIKASLGNSNTVPTGIVTTSFGEYFLGGSGCNCWLQGGRHNLSTIPGDSGSPIWHDSPSQAIGVHSSSGGWFGLGRPFPFLSGCDDVVTPTSRPNFARCGATRRSMAARPFPPGRS